MAAEQLMPAVPVSGTDPSSLCGPDRAAILRMHAVCPVWRGMGLARDEIAFPERTILHAGPPVTPGDIARPLLNSIAMAILFEGWATDEPGARAMLRAGDVRLAPAQPYGVMAPLAAVLSPNMAVQIVADRDDPANVAYSPINGGMVSAQHLGLAGPRILRHLRWVNGNLAATLRIIADRDIELVAIADEALAAGDDCHGRTGLASALVIGALSGRIGCDTPERRFLDGAPGFFLNLWMAAVRCIAQAGEGPGSSLITGFGGNGVEVGLQLGGTPGRWFVAPAGVPVGPLLAGFADSDRLGAIGDSALVDAIGFGAMVTRPASAGNLLPVPHPAFTRTRTAVGLPARRIVETGTAPTIALGVLDQAGKAGRIGGGLYRPPTKLFAAACQALGEQHRAVQRLLNSFV